MQGLRAGVHGLAPAALIGEFGYRGLCATVRGTAFPNRAPGASPVTLLLTRANAVTLVLTVRVGC